MAHKRFGSFSSSVNPEKLAATWSGILKVVGAVAGFMVIMGLIDAASASALVAQVEVILNAITAIVAGAYAVYGACQAIYGISRKVLVALGLMQSGG